MTIPKEATVITNEDIARHVAKGRRYTLVLLRRGSHRDQDEASAGRIQQEHLRHLRSLRAAGMLLVNGPCLDDGDIRGVSIYDTTDEATLRALRP